jgi:hypothetical protein
VSPVLLPLRDGVSNCHRPGVSLITQALYCVVFIVRYLDLFSNLHGFLGFWNFSLKVFYISSSLYIVFLMTRVYARTREREKAWKMGIWSVAGSLVTAPVVAAIFVGRDAFKWRTLFDVSFPTGYVPGTAMLTSTLTDPLHLHAYPRIPLHSSATTPPPPNVSPDCHRQLLPRHSRFLPRLLYPQLDPPQLH